MPFTFAHPVAIIPVNNKFKSYFCLTGLILGSMAPDFEYFIHFRPYAVYGHSIIGLFILNLPLCFLLAFVFHFVMKIPLVIHMPKPISNWLGSFIKPWNLNSFRKVIVFVYSTIIGMLTHLVWDSFSHAEGIVVKLVPFLSSQISVFGYSIFLYKLVQHGSTIIGIFIILIYLYTKRNQGAEVVSIPAVKKLLFYFLIALTSFILVFGIIYIKVQSLGSVDIGSIVVIIIVCLFLGTLLISIVSRVWQKPGVITKASSSIG